MKHFGAVLALCSLCVIVLALTVRYVAQKKKPDAPRSDLPMDFREIVDNHSFLFEGYWRSTKEDRTKSFDSPVRIHCTAIDLKCIETRAMLSTGKFEEKEWNITTWDPHRLIASYGDDPASPCQRHVLTMNFDLRAAAVSASDIPTHRKGCEAFTETESYDFERVMAFFDVFPPPP